MVFNCEGLPLSILSRSIFALQEFLRIHPFWPRHVIIETSTHESKNGYRESSTKSQFSLSFPVIMISLLCNLSKSLVCLNYSALAFDCSSCLKTEEVILNEERTTDEEKMKIIEGIF